MIEKPLVSVVIATYNMANYLPIAIQSVLAQTYENFELLIVDDGSTDNTREIVKPFLNDSRVRYFRQENKGQPAALNHGIRESAGEYLAFLDADDIWVSEKLELQIPLFSQSEKLGVIYSGVVCIDENGLKLDRSSGRLFRGRLTNLLLIRNLIGFGTSVVKKDCFNHIGGFNENIKWGNDYDLWLRLSTKYEFDYIDQFLLHYRVWPNQMTYNSGEKIYLSAIGIMKSFLAEFPGAVDKNTVNEAWAHTYVGYGQCLQRRDRRIGPALRLYARALHYKPNYLPAWKSIVKAILPRHLLAILRH